MSERRRNRSDQYQSLYHESSCSHDMLSIFPNDASIHDRLSGGFGYDESILELEDELKDEFWKIVNTLLTDRQKEVIKLYSTGLTQMEVAAQLGVNQSSIAKNLWGNAQYVDNYKRIYGGSSKKIQKLAEASPKIKEILDKINEIRNEKW